MKNMRHLPPVEFWVKYKNAVPLIVKVFSFNLNRRILLVFTKLSTRIYSRFAFNLQISPEQYISVDHTQMSGIQSVGGVTYQPLSGKEMVNVVPTPGVDATEILPPMRKMVCLAMDSPNPAPWCSRSA